MAFLSPAQTSFVAIRQKRTCRFVWPDQNLSIVMRKSSSIYLLLVARNRPDHSRFQAGGTAPCHLKGRRPPPPKPRGSLPSAI